MRCRLLVVAASIAVLALSAAPPADASDPTAPRREKGRVVHVADGDTIDVDVFGDGTSSPLRVRLSGINAVELGECHAETAKDRLRALVGGRTVTLHAADRDPRTGGRLLRQVVLPRSDGSSLDVNLQLLREGMALWFPLGDELRHIDVYHLAAEEARRDGKGIWRDDACGRGPTPDLPLSMWAKSDADSADGRNLRDEYVVIANDGGTDVDIGGWTLRDSSLFTYTVPTGTTVRAGDRVTVRVGEGRDTATVKHMGRSVPLLDNTDAATGAGDGVYLIDPHGDIRLAFTWPCVLDCDEPLRGDVRITDVVYDPAGADTAEDEVVTLRNVSTRRVSLDGYQLRTWPYAHAFRPGTYLRPGERLTVSMGGGEETRTRQFLGRDGPVLNNGGDVVELLSWDERPAVDCEAWGDAECPQPPPIPSLPPTRDVPSDAVPVVGDWNGDGRATPGRFEGGRWYLSNTLTSDADIVVSYGRSGDLPIVGDWDGDGRDTLGVVRDGTWHLRDRLAGGSADRSFKYGRVAQGDIPIVGDWDSDGRDTPGVVRDGRWYLRNKLSGGPGQVSFKYGRVTRGDIPIVGDWDRDGRDTPGVVRDGTWYLRNKLSGGPGQVEFKYGRVTRGDIPIVGDWDRDGRDTPGVVRDGTWYLRNKLSGGPGQVEFKYGRVTRGDIPVVGDWDGDGRDTPGVVRDGTWYLRDRLAGGRADVTIDY